jgi:hypothetical protein
MTARAEHTDWRTAERGAVTAEEDRTADRRVALWLAADLVARIRSKAGS